MNISILLTAFNWKKDAAVYIQAVISLPALLICVCKKYFAAFCSSVLTAKRTPPKSCTFQYLYGFKTYLLSSLFFFFFLD